jgi:uncharacterized protein
VSRAECWRAAITRSGGITLTAFTLAVSLHLPAETLTFKVPVRGGVLLAADVYGADATRPKPVLLSRTPYNKASSSKEALEYERHGYVVVIQDCRGRFASEGSYTPYNDDRQDGFDTIEWINRQPWSNGRVGMFGGSHLGLVQWLAMAEKAPGLTAIAPAFTSSSLYRVAYRDGALRLALIGSGGTRAHPPPDGRTLPSEIGMLHHHLPLMHLPLARLQDAYGWKLPWMTSLLEHPEYSGFWRQTSAEQDIASSDVPVQIITGYYDFFHHDAVQDFYRLLARKSKAPAQLILGPWTHGSAGRARTQDVDFGPASILDVQKANLDWFDRFLKGKSTAAPSVRYFVMGENRWREAESWPPPQSRREKLYLRANRSAAFSAPETSEGSSVFMSDPLNPVPSIPPARRDIDRAALWSPLDYSAISARPDVLSFTTEPLLQPRTIAGPFTAELWVESDTPDADWVVRVFAVPPQGIALPLVQGIGRAAFRDSLERSVKMVPGRQYKLSIDLGSSAVALPAGYRLRVEIAGSSFPMYDRNTHTADGPFSAGAAVARQRVHHHQRQASSIVMDILTDAP